MLNQGPIGGGSAPPSGAETDPVFTAALTGLVRTTTDQSIGGVKTFTSSPVIPAPTTDLQAATKKYVDDNISDPVAPIVNPVIEAPIIQESVSITAGFVGTVSSSGTTVTFSSSLDAIVAGYSATSPIIGTAVTADGITVWIRSWNDSTHAVVDPAPSPAWAADTITSIQYPITSVIDSTGAFIEYITAAGASNKQIKNYDVEVLGIVTAEGFNVPEYLVPSTGSLTVDQLKSSQLNNTGQLAENTQTLPTCVAGLASVISLPESGVGDFHLKAGPSDKIYLDGVPLDNGDKVSITPDATNLVRGIIESFYDSKTSKYNWVLTSGPNSTWIDGGA